MRMNKSICILILILSLFCFFGGVKILQLTFFLTRNDDTIRHLLSASLGKSEFVKKRVPILKKKGVKYHNAIEILSEVYDACNITDTDLNLILAIIEVESGFVITAKGNAGEIGLCQIMPFWKKVLPYDNLKRVRNNIMSCIFILKFCGIEGKYNMESAIRKYNAGELGKDSEQAHIHKEKVMKRYKEWNQI